MQPVWFLPRLSMVPPRTASPALPPSVIYISEPGVEVGCCGLFARVAPALRGLLLRALWVLRGDLRLQAAPLRCPLLPRTLVTPGSD